MSNKYKEYARSKTSLRGRGPTKEQASPYFLGGLVNKVVNTATKTAKDYIADVNNKMLDATTAAMGKMKSANEKASDYMNKTLDSTVMPQEKVDSRSQLTNFVNTGEGGGDVYLNKQTGIALIDNLSMVNALPPIPDNVVDPPPIWEKSDVKGDLRTFGSTSGAGNYIVGRDYLQRVIARGQFLTLVPLDIVPNMTGNLGQYASDMKNKAADIIGITRFMEKSGTGLLKTLDERLNVASYGLVTKVNSLKYFRAVNAHMKVALMSLGIDIFDNRVNPEMVKMYLPDVMVDKLFGNDASSLMNIKKQLGTEDRDKDSSDDVETHINSSDNVNKFSWKDIFGSSKNASPNATDHVQSLDEHVAHRSYANLLKFITNIDEYDMTLQSLPIACFYCNGPVERSMGTNAALGESAIAKATTDIGKTVTGGLVGTGKNEGAALINDMMSSGEDYIREMAYHRNLGGFLVSNTYIPNVIKSASIDFQYTVNIRDVAVSSDRYSIARLFWTLSQLFPFVIQTNSPDQSLVIPSSPMYCSAFIKGIMNLPRAAITSLAIRTNPEFQTTEGIPTELDITVTIQPLFSQSTMPNFDKFYNGSNHPEYLAAAMFNPLSSFNIIATLCGQNTILTKAQYGLIEFFIGGAISTFYDNIKNTGAVIHSTWQDWWASEGVLKNEVMSRTRILGDV